MEEINKRIKIKNVNNRQEVSINIDGVDYLIFSLDDPSMDNYCGYIYDENYLLICQARIVDPDDLYNRHKLISVREVFDIKSNQLLDLDQETKYRLYDMYVSQKYFTIDVVISLLTNHNFCHDEAKIQYLYNFLSSFNENITYEDIQNYIMNCYPELASFKNIKSLLLNKNKIVNQVGYNIPFKAMKQDIQLLDSYIREKNDLFVKKYGVRK